MDKMFLPNGTPAPLFTQNAEVTKREVSVQSAPGALLLIFHSYQTATAVAEVIQDLRKVYQSPQQVLIAGITDLRPVPRLLRGTARGMIEKAYREAAKRVPQGQDPADHIIILSDWNGDLFEKYRVPETSRQVALVFINEAKQIAGSYLGDQPSRASLAFMNGKSQISNPPF